MSTTHTGRANLTVRLPAVRETPDLPVPVDPVLLDPVRPAPGPDRATPRRWRPRPDLIVYGSFLLFAFWLTRPYFIGGQVSQVDVSDQAFFEYVLAHGAHVVTHLSNPLFATQLNAPVGVNLMVNTSILALAIPLTPVTLLFGPASSFALLMLLGLAGAAAAWYFVLSRHVVASRSAAVIGGLIAGFGPGMIAHATGHPNIIAQFLLPFIVWRTIRLREPGRHLRNGLVLGLLVTVQTFINEEILFITAIALAVFVTAYGWSRRDAIKAEVRPFAAGLGIAVGVAGVLLAYPLWWQFFGPNTFHGIDPGVRAFSTDLAAFPAFATRSIIGGFSDNARLSRNVTEQNAFLGWPLLIAAAVAIYWLRRQVVARSLVIAAFVLAVLSLGPTIKIDGHLTGVPGPWRLLINLPIFDSAVPTRFSLLILPIVAVLVALAHDRAMRRDRVPGRSLLEARVTWCLLLAVALGSVFPTPVTTQPLAPTPAFISSGEWRRYVPAGDTVLPVPLPAPYEVDAMFWDARTDLSFSMPGGYFLGPDPAHHDVANFGARPRPTATLLAEVFSSQVPAVVTRSNRAEALADLRYWQTAVMVLPQGTQGEAALRETISDLVGGKPEFQGGAWVWDVRDLVSGHANADLD